MEGDNIPNWLYNVRHYDNELGFTFNLDHPFRIGKKSFVFYPYHYDVKQIESFRKYLEERGYRLHFSSMQSEYGHHTHRVLLIHESEKKDWTDNSLLFKKSFRKITMKARGIVRSFSLRATENKNTLINDQETHVGEWTISHDIDNEEYVITNGLEHITLHAADCSDLLKITEKILSNQLDYDWS